MENHSTGTGFPEAYDANLDNLLATVGRFAPSGGFEDRVMARVSVPNPLWVQRWQYRARALAESTRVRWIARGLVASSVISVTLIATFVATNAAQVSAFFGARFGSLLLGMWRGVLGLGSTALRTLYGAVGAGTASMTVLLGIAIVATVVLLFNSWALYKLMQPGGVVGERHALRS